MKKIMIDMDDVICDGGFLSLVNEFLHTNYDISQIKTYYIQDLIPKERFQEWSEFFNSKNVYDYSKLIPNAYEVIEKLSHKYEIYIVSAYIFRENEEYSAKNLKNKFEWLYKNLPFISPENYVFTSKKEIVNCDIKIDDKLSNLDGDAEMKLLFTAYHNKNISEKELENKNVKRVNGWKHIEEILL